MLYSWLFPGCVCSSVKWGWGGGIGRMPVILGPAATRWLMVITASDSCMIDMLRIRADMTPGFYTQEAALECLPTEIQGRASAESPLAQGLASLKRSCHFFSANCAVGSVLSLLVHCHSHNFHVESTCTHLSSFCKWEVMTHSWERQT